MSTPQAMLELHRRIAQLEKEVAEYRNRPYASLHAQPAQAHTISSGAITPHKSHIVLSAESGTTDDLTTINAEADGKMLVLRAAATHTITVKHNVGNIDLLGSTNDVVLDHPLKSLTLIYVASTLKWTRFEYMGLGDLYGVYIGTPPTTGDVLTYTGSDWQPAATTPGATSLDGLSDVAIAAPADGQVLVYHTPANEWSNEAASWVPTAQLGIANGVATLDGTTLVVQNPANAQATAAASKIPLSDGSGKIDNGWLKTGSGNGLDADTVDGSHASAFAAASHTHSHTVLTDIGTNSHATIDSHIANTSNPHNVTKTQVGLGSVDNVQQLPLSYLDLDKALTANSDVKVPSQKAIKFYVDNILSNANALVYKDTINCSTNPNYPMADAGFLYIVSAAGKIGGASGVTVDVGDMLICNQDGASSGDQATVGSYWNIIEKNIIGAVTGPASSTDGNLALFDGTTGKVIKAGNPPPANTPAVTNQFVTAYNASTGAYSQAQPDHGSLTGLTDDDHTQYHNDARGDARYVALTGDQTVAGLKTFQNAGAAIVTERTTTATNGIAAVQSVKITTSNDMADGFGGDIVFQIQDNAGVNNSIAVFGAVRAGADNSGAFVIYTANAGSLAERMRVMPNGDTGIQVTAPAAKLHVDQSSTTAAEPVLLLDQADVSEEFIEFVSTSAANNTNPISTTALGTYAGKLRINVNGTYYWLPFYNA